MNYVGYKWFDEAKTRRSADVLKMESGESLDKFKKRCTSLGYDCVDGRNLVDHYKFLSDEYKNNYEIIYELSKSKKYGYKKEKFVNAELFSDKSISLPVGPHLSKTNVRYILKTALNIFKNY